MVFSFSSFVIFVDIFKVLECVLLIFHIFEFSHHISGPTVYISHFSRFSVFLAVFLVLPGIFLNFLLCQFLAIFHFLQCTFVIFHIFQLFSPYSTSYSVCFSFSTFFSFFRQNPGPTVCISHISHFHCFSLYSRS